jgi:hypothetical protein
MSAPLPSNWLLHGVALFSDRKDHVTPFLARLHDHFAEVAVPEDAWTVQETPRPCLFGPFAADGWQMRLLFDGQGAPGSVLPAVKDWVMSEAALTAIQSHQSAAMLFALRAPPGSVPLERVRIFSKLMWEWLRLGASAIVWPSGRKAYARDELRAVDPMTLSPDQFELLVGMGPAGPAADGRRWLRTFGLGQFELPDLACNVTAQGTDRDSELERVKNLFGSVPPYLVAGNRLLRVGETVTLSDQEWRIAGWADKQTQPFLASDLGTQLFELARVREVVSG